MNEIANLEDKNVMTSEVVADIVRETGRLEAVWLECSFAKLGCWIRCLKEKAAKEEGLNGIVCEVWVEIAEKIFECRVEELTGLPVVKGLLDD